MERGLVTGGGGFVGRAIVRALLSREIRVRVLLCPEESAAPLEGLEVEIVRGDVRDPEACVRAVEGMDTVFHAAARYDDWAPDPGPMYDVNLRGTFHVLEACRRADVPRVIYTASMVSLGPPPAGEVGDELTPFRAWERDFTYVRSKFLSRQLAEDFARWGLDVRVVCPGVVFGPGDDRPTPSGRLILEAARGAPPFYTEGGASYVDVRDVAEVHVLAAERGQPGARYLATAHNLSTLDLLRAIDRALGRHRRYVKLPPAAVRPLIRAYERYARQSGHPPRLTLDFFEYNLEVAHYRNDKSVLELGASYRPLDDTLGDAVRYFRSRGLL